MLFAARGYKVTLYDIEDARVAEALSYIEGELKRLEVAGLLRGKLTAKQQFSCVSGAYFNYTFY